MASKVAISSLIAFQYSSANLPLVASCQLGLSALLAAEWALRNWGAEILADPYKGKIPLGGVNAFQEPFASHQVIQQDTPNIRRANQYLKHTETCMKYSFLPIATE